MLRRRMVVSNAATNLQNFFGITANRREIVRAETSAHRDQPYCLCHNNNPEGLQILGSCVFLFCATTAGSAFTPALGGGQRTRPGAHHHAEIRLWKQYDNRPPENGRICNAGTTGLQICENGYFYNHLTTIMLYKNNSFLPPPRLRSHCDRYAMAWRQIPNRRA